MVGVHGSLKPAARILSLLLASTHATGARQTESAWPVYGGDPGGQRYANAAQINRNNVARLHMVWQYHTRALDPKRSNRTEAAFEATPILHGRSLFFSTPFDQVLSVDAATGAERWRFDPNLPSSFSAAIPTSRGVAFWSSADPAATCPERIFLATLDARLIALDDASGTPCPEFGSHGTVDLRHGVPTQTTFPYQGYGVSSPVTVVGDVVVVGSSVADGQEVDVEPGIVRGYDALSGKLLWTWDPLPWARCQAVRTGGGNTWSTIAADPRHNLVYLPTGSPAPDFFGGMRPGDDRDANSVVALDVRTGKKVWAFQVVHHDLWDYDVAAEPLLFEFQNKTPAIAIATKMGTIFVLNRLSGIPIFPVEERPVPPSDVPGEIAAATQPFSSLPSLSPLSLRAEDLKGHTPADAQACAAQIADLRDGGIFTPPSLRGSLLYPGSLGGVNWGSPAFDPRSGVLFVNSNQQAFMTKLIPRWRFRLDDLLGSWENWIYAAASLLVLLWLLRRSFTPGWVGGFIALALVLFGAVTGLRKPHQIQHFGTETAPQRKSPFAVRRAPLTDGHGLPCTPVPWGKITALNLNTGTKLWERPLGTMIDGQQTGSLNLGGPIITGGGLVFTAAVRSPVLQAFNSATGALVWTGALPAPAQSTPMTFVLDGKQIVVVAAGGHGGFGTPIGDSLVAFALD